jgi:NDP-sugar pyrophosphorylase family protein
LWNYTKVENGSYIWYSILWNDVIIGEKCITKDEKEDNSSIHVMIKWECIDSKIHKLWVIIWSYTKINSQTLTLPGKIIENNCIL